MVAEVARLWRLDSGRTKLWRVRLLRVDTGFISEPFLSCGSVCASSYLVSHMDAGESQDADSRLPSLEKKHCCIESRFLCYPKQSVSVPSVQPQ